MMEQAPSATDSAAVVPSVRHQPAHREGWRRALFMQPLYCMTIPAGIGSVTISREERGPPGPLMRTWRSALRLALPEHRQGTGHQGHETHRHQGVALQAAFALDDALDDLRGGIAPDRHDQDAAERKLIDQRLRA